PLGVAGAASHAAAIGPGAAWAVAVDVSHVIAAGLWVGGLPALALLLHAAGRNDDAQARATALGTARRFSHAALVAVLVLVASGSAGAVAQIGSVAALAGTTHGHLLLAKLPLLAGAGALVVVAAALGLPPVLVEAYPTTFRRPPVTYHATSIASGIAVYAEHCASCHGADGAGVAGADLRSPSIARRHAGEIF